MSDVEPRAGFLLGTTIHLETALNTMIPKEELCFTKSTNGPSEVAGIGEGTTSHG